ncbi:stromal 70 kDa heat shock-related protein, chloroplastic-like protein [Tanacetum coccineum]|uniref:Stromal 70 kDa heat shock-related protein, chloroplastic-like protein n=1 Tax=Tanacetum coccineum TaxID=301880 RepID=A0ABQ5HXV5_9ASTR
MNEQSHYKQDNDKTKQPPTRMIVDWLAKSFKRNTGLHLLKDREALQCFTKTTEKAMMELSTLTQTNISLPFITMTSDGLIHVDTHYPFFNNDLTHYFNYA